MTLTHWNVMALISFVVGVSVHRGEPLALTMQEASIVWAWAFCAVALGVLNARGNDGKHESRTD